MCSCSICDNDCTTNEFLSRFFYKRNQVYYKTMVKYWLGVAGVWVNPKYRLMLMHYIVGLFFCTYLIEMVPMHVVKDIAQCSVQVSNMSPKVSSPLEEHSDLVMHER